MSPSSIAPSINLDVWVSKTFVIAVAEGNASFSLPANVQHASIASAILVMY